jgi:hypothetical protein
MEPDSLAAYLQQIFGSQPPPEVLATGQPPDAMDDASYNPNVRRMVPPPAEISRAATQPSDQGGGFADALAKLLGRDTPPGAISTMLRGGPQQPPDGMDAKTMSGPPPPRPAASAEAPPPAPLPPGVVMDDGKGGMADQIQTAFSNPPPQYGATPPRQGVGGPQPQAQPVPQRPQAPPLTTTVNREPPAKEGFFSANNLRELIQDVARGGSAVRPGMGRGAAAVAGAAGAANAGERRDLLREQTKAANNKLLLDQTLKLRNDRRAENKDAREEAARPGIDALRDAKTRAALARAIKVDNPDLTAEHVLSIERRVGEKAKLYQADGMSGDKLVAKVEEYKKTLVDEVRKTVKKGGADQTKAAPSKGPQTLTPQQIDELRKGGALNGYRIKPDKLKNDPSTWFKSGDAWEQVR